MIRLVPIEQLFKDSLMKKIQVIVRRHVSKWGKPWLFEDACGHVYLNIIPALRNYSPSKYDNFSAWLETTVKHSIITFHYKNTKDTYSKTLKKQVRIKCDIEFQNDEGEKMSFQITDPGAEKSFKQYENWQYHRYVWLVLLPKLLGAIHTKILFYRFVGKLSFGKAGAKFNNSDAWALKKYNDAIYILRVCIKQNKKIRSEFLR